MAKRPKRTTRVKKTMTDLPGPITPENFASMMEYLYPDNLHKELYWTRKPPEETLYRWYYDFIKASREHPSVRNEVAEDPATAQKMADVDNAFGETNAGFLTWWQSGGAEKFAETGVPRIKVLNDLPNELDIDHLEPLRVEIPLHLSRDIILEQLNFLLAAHHPGDGLRRHAYSTAAIKIFPRQRYPATDYEFLLELWKAVRTYREQGQSVHWVRAYCEAARMQGVWEQFENISRNDRESKNKRDQYIRTAKKLYKQADLLMKNALIGYFPRDDQDE